MATTPTTVVRVVTDGKGRVQGIYDTATGAPVAYELVAAVGRDARAAEALSTRSEQERDAGATHLACATCGRAQPTVRCAGCISRRAVYCDAACAAQHWASRHGRHCASVKSKTKEPT